MKKHIPVFGLTSGLEFSRPGKATPPVRYIVEPTRGLVYRALRAPMPNERYLPEPKERLLRYFRRSA